MNSIWKIPIPSFSCGTKSAPHEKLQNFIWLVPEERRLDAEERRSLMSSGSPPLHYTNHSADEQAIKSKPIAQFSKTVYRGSLSDKNSYLAKIWILFRIYIRENHLCRKFEAIIKMKLPGKNVLKFMDWIICSLLRKPYR